MKQFKKTMKNSMQWGLHVTYAPLYIRLSVSGHEKNDIDKYLEIQCRVEKGQLEGENVWSFFRITIKAAFT